MACLLFKRYFFPSKVDVNIYFFITGISVEQREIKKQWSTYDEIKKHLWIKIYLINMNDEWEIVKIIKQ